MTNNNRPHPGGVKSCLKWVGGKAARARKLTALLPEHKAYIEPFAGALSVLMRKSESRLECVNDVDKNLITFWRVLRDQKDELMDRLMFMPASRDIFYEFAEKLKTDTFDGDIDRAVCFFYINRAAFGADMTSPAFGAPSCRGKSVNASGFRPSYQMPLLENCWGRLQNVLIENKSYEFMFSQYDNPQSLFFLDPPYHKTKSYRGGSFRDEDFTRLAGLCRGMKGRFLMTINDDPFIRDTFTGFNIRDVQVTYTVNSDRNDLKTGELLIANYDLPAAV